MSWYDVWDSEQTIHYTNQLHKETSAHLKDLAHLRLPASSSEQVSWQFLFSAQAATQTIDTNHSKGLNIVMV